MSENRARRYRAGALPSQRHQPRRYMTRLDPFAAVWPEVEAMLEQAPATPVVTSTLAGSVAVIARPSGVGVSRRGGFVLMLVLLVVHNLWRRLLAARLARRG
jgi:hypothetical protein